VRAGFWLTVQHPRTVRPADALRDHVEQVAVARELGFDMIMAGQHFLPDPYWMLQTVPLLARLAAEAGEMRVATGILLLTLLNPLEVAENLATLDVISGGRCVAGVGLGYRTEENAAFGVGRGRGDLFATKLGIVRRLLAGEEVTASGPGFALHRARLAPLPASPPPFWIGANGDAAVRRAAVLGDAWLVNPHSRLADIERQCGLHRRAREEAGLPAVPVLPITREVCVAATDERAMELARPYVEAKYAAYVRWGQSEVQPPADTLRRPWEELVAGSRFIIGSPETCVALIREYRRRLGPLDLVCRVQWPGMPQSEVLGSLRLLGREVLPALD
jgi:alkanesulfonate monooxygenase SsuD/methylene tetrahydromethanopterin reductase-like flavin-dependent oxidoreductase (luciferase family)